MQKTNAGTETELSQETQMDMRPLRQGRDATAEARTSQTGIPSPVSSFSPFWLRYA
jgi:hypothetical protein